MILANNNKKWVSSQLFGFSRAKLGPLRKGHHDHLMFITEFLLIWPVGYIEHLLSTEVRFLINLQKKESHFEKT